MVVYQSRIYRADLQMNPYVKYLFGDNLLRQGYGGQAGEMRDEPNAIGVATKRWPSRDESAFFSDDRYIEQIKIIRNDLAPAFKHVSQGGILVIPADGLGTGLSELPRRAPKTNNFLVEILSVLSEDPEEWTKARTWNFG